MNNIVELSGEIVTLRTYQDSDLEALIEVGKDVRIWEYYRLRGLTESKHMIAWEEKDKERNNFRHFTLIDIQSNEIIGYTGIWAINWETKKGLIGSSFLNPNYWGKGHNKEAKKLLIQHAFDDLGLETLSLGCDINNKRSYFSALNAGFEFVKIREKFTENVDNTWADFAFFELKRI